MSLTKFFPLLGIIFTSSCAVLSTYYYSQSKTDFIKSTDSLFKYFYLSNKAKPFAVSNVFHYEHEKFSFDFAIGNPYQKIWMMGIIVPFIPMLGYSEGYSPEEFRRGLLHEFMGVYIPRDSKKVVILFAIKRKNQPETYSTNVCNTTLAVKSELPMRPVGTLKFTVAGFSVGQDFEKDLETCSEMSNKKNIEFFKTKNLSEYIADDFEVFYSGIVFDRSLTYEKEGKIIFPSIFIDGKEYKIPDVEFGPGSELKFVIAL